MSDQNLENSWKSVTHDMPKPVSEWWWSLLLKKYLENGRNTHDLRYLREKFKEFEFCKNKIKNCNAFGLALFFQYFEYNARDAECYTKNIDVFYKFATEANIGDDSEIFQQVKYLLEASTIHSTEEHKTTGAFGETDLHYFLDIDMVVLGSSTENYKKYIEDLHEEYSFLDSSSYMALRKKVLQSFLLIPNIYSTREFREKYESQARKNIQEELETLSK